MNIIGYFLNVSTWHAQLRHPYFPHLSIVLQSFFPLTFAQLLRARIYAIGAKVELHRLAFDFIFCDFYSTLVQLVQENLEELLMHTQFFGWNHALFFYGFCENQLCND